MLIQEDGRFSVTWRSKGAPVTTLPHVSIPDHSGRYDLNPAFSSIHLSFQSDGYFPRDFSGDGHFRIDGATLVLQNIRLGTRQVKRKAYICELTFARVVESVHS